MKKSKYLGALIAGSLAGIVNGLFGAGGGMLLIPLLCELTPIDSEQLFPTSVAVILPMCLISILITAFQGPLPLPEAAPYLIGSAIGGILAGIWGKKIPKVWLHRILGLMILWGGIRYLWF